MHDPLFIVKTNFCKLSLWGIPLFEYIDCSAEFEQSEHIQQEEDTTKIVVNHI